jgi:hypothetical protein
MLMATPAARSGAVQSSLVNCEPWSVLKIGVAPLVRTDILFG